MKSLRFFLVLLLVWLGTQIVIWGWSEFILKGSQLERVLELEDVEPYLKIPFYLLFPVPYAEAYSVAGEMGFGWWLVEHYLPYHVNRPNSCGLGESTRGR